MMRFFLQPSIPPVVSQTLTTDSNKLSAKPIVILAMELADTGAMTSRSAHLRSSTCSMPLPLTSYPWLVPLILVTIDAIVILSLVGRVKQWLLDILACQEILGDFCYDYSDGYIRVPGKSFYNVWKLYIFATLPLAARSKYFLLSFACSDATNSVEMVEGCSGEGRICAAAIAWLYPVKKLRSRIE